MFYKLTIFCPILLTIFLCGLNAAELELTKKEQSALDKGEILITEKEIKDAPWPEYRILGIVDVTPIEAIAIFSDYEAQKEYIPDLLSAKITKVISKFDKQVSFEMNVPWPMSNTRYTTGNIIKKNGDGLYELSWYYVSSDSTKENRGFARFHKYKNRTIFEYKSLVWPKSFFAVLISNMVQDKLEKTYRSITDRFLLIKTKKPEQLKQYLSKLPF